MSEIRDTQRYVEQLSKAEFFRDFEPPEFEELLQVCERKSLAPRESLWAVGSPKDAAYILVEGRVEQTRRLPPDGQRVEQIDRPGSLLSLSSLVKEWKHQSSATALERTELLRLEREDFRRLFDDEQIAAYRLVDELAEQLVAEMRDANRRLHEVFGSPAETLRTLRRRVRQS